MSKLLFDQEHDGAEPPQPPEQHERRRGGRLLAAIGIVVAVLLVATVAAGLWVRGKIDPSGGPGEEVAVSIPEGTSTAGIAQLLADEGVVSDASAFRYYVRFKGGGPFQAGDYTLRQNSAMGDVVAALEEGPELVFDRLTVPEGLTLEEISERVEEIERFSSERFLEVAESGSVRSRYQPEGVDSLEGLLFPDTYQLDAREDEEALVTRMVEQFDAVATNLGYERAEEQVGLTPYEAIVVASLVESEARVPEDRAKISRVIHNRIEKDMLLQIDATVIYAMGGEPREGGRVLFSDLETDSPYNTYKNPGLPPTPIAVPGRAALEAALNPEEGDWLYYVKYEEDGTHAFSTTNEEHNRRIAEAKAKGVNP
ncbi:MAG: endolytic transglycosylase MltG [Actinobacteria bacterium]|nr:endolytic transglycosylase MltG [Actinomycetota bacterium]